MSDPEIGDQGESARGPEMEAQTASQDNEPDQTPGDPGSFPAETIDGETVTIVDKRIEDATRPLEGTILVADDGREFTRNANNQLVPVAADVDTPQAEAPASDQPPSEEPDTGDEEGSPKEAPESETTTEEPAAESGVQVEDGGGEE